MISLEKHIILYMKVWNPVFFLNWFINCIIFIYLFFCWFNATQVLQLRLSYCRNLIHIFDGILELNISQPHLFTGQQNPLRGECYPPSSTYMSSHTPVVNQHHSDWQRRECKPLLPRQHGQFCSPGLLVTDGVGIVSDLRMIGRRLFCSITLKPMCFLCFRSSLSILLCLLANCFVCLFQLGLCLPIWTASKAFTRNYIHLSQKLWHLLSGLVSMHRPVY